MILFTLRCAEGHEFEGWFRDGDGFEMQQKAGEISCPQCGDSHIEKALMAPNIGRSRSAGPPLSPAQMRAALVELRRQVETNCITSARALPRRRAKSITARPIRTGSTARQAPRSCAN